MGARQEGINVYWLFHLGIKIHKTDATTCGHVHVQGGGTESRLPRTCARRSDHQSPFRSSQRRFHRVLLSPHLHLHFHIHHHTEPLRSLPWQWHQHRIPHSSATHPSDCFLTPSNASRQPASSWHQPIHFSRTTQLVDNARSFQRSLASASRQRNTSTSSMGLR